MNQEFIISGNGTSAEFELDADGDVLREAVKSKSPAAISNTTSMEDVDVSSPNGSQDDDDRDENGGGGIV